MKKMISNQKGIGLVAVLIAAGLLALMAYSVSHFISNYHSQSQRIESSTECENVAKNIVEYIKKDEASLVIYSNGPDTDPANLGNFPVSGVGTTEDSIEMYGFMPAPIPVYEGPATNLMSLPGGGAEAALPNAGVNNWSFNNYLSIKNSVNRLIALSATSRCCADLNNCSAIRATTNNGYDYYVSGRASPPNPKSLIITESSVAGAVQAKLGINILEDGTSLCTGTRLTRLPDIRKRITAEFRLGVLINKNTPNQKYCEAAGSVQQSVDDNAPYTIMQVNNGTGANQLCDGTKLGNPSLCQPNNQVTIDLRTYRDGRPNSCSAFLANTPTVTRCAAGGVVTDVFANAEQGSDCVQSDPGSIFMCRIVEQNRFYNGANVNWEPCEVAKVYDGAGNAVANARVTIDYNRPTNGNGTDRYTAATLTISNIDVDAAYVVDVRAVDTQGRKVGPSFCSLGRSCSPVCRGGTNAGAHCASAVTCTGGGTCDGVTSPTFVVNANIRPSLSTPTSQGGSINTASNLNPSNPALTAFGANLFQCGPGSAGRFSSVVSYTPGLPAGWASLGLGGQCGAVITKPAGAAPPTQTITNPASMSDLCSISGAGTTPADPSGNYSIALTYTNDCGHAATNPSPPKTWCYDNDVTFNVNMQQNTVADPGPTPNFNIVNSKKCGLITKAPMIHGPPGGWVPLTNTFTFPDWNPVGDSGCLAYSAPQTCMQGYDPCGRAFSTATSYASFLPIGAANKCQSLNGTNGLVRGNQCVTTAGTFCGNDLGCHNDYRPNPANLHAGKCWNDTECATTGSATCAANPPTCGTTLKCEMTSTKQLTPVAGCDPTVGTTAVGSSCRANQGTCQGTGGTCSLNSTVTCSSFSPCTPANGTCVYTAAHCSLDNLQNCLGAGGTLDATQCSSARMGTCQIFGTAGTCIAPTNKSCNICPSAPSTADQKFCPVAWACDTVPTSVTPTTLSCGSAPPVIPPTPDNCVSQDSACDPVTKLVTTHWTCTGPNCPPTCPPDTTTSCDCTWHMGTRSNDDVFCHAAGHSGPGSAVCGSGVGGSYCGAVGPTDVCGDPGFVIGGACTCGQWSGCLLPPVLAGHCPSVELRCGP